MTPAVLTPAESGRSSRGRAREGVDALLALASLVLVLALGVAVLPAARGDRGTERQSCAQLCGGRGVVSFDLGWAGSWRCECVTACGDPAEGMREVAPSGPSVTYGGEHSL